MELMVGAARTPPVEALEAEVVERKGRGHPDTICDALAERLSASLSRFYLDCFGEVLHHNVDKALLWAGAARPAFGGGEVLAPIEVYLAGRATPELEGITVPVAELAVEGSRAWLRQNLRALDPDRHVRIHCLVRAGSAELVASYRRGGRVRVPLANDTSVGVGFAPLSRLERTVAAVEAHLNSAEVKAACPEIGEDVKVMGTRRGDRLHLTVACAFVGRHVSEMSDYLEKRERARVIAREAARAAAGGEVEVDVNSADDPAGGSVYLTVTGTSAEAGDDGQAGRGNRANGLITPYRPMSLEGAAGKNPVTHVGKLYQVAAGRIARTLVDSVPGVLSAECYLVSRIGRPVADPWLADVKLRISDGRIDASLRAGVEAVVRAELEGLGALSEAFVRGEIAVY